MLILTSYATVDGARVATETDHIICSATPLPGTMLFLGTGLIGLLGLAANVSNVLYVNKFLNYLKGGRNVASLFSSFLH